MRPAILTDDVLERLDLESDLDAVERPPTDDGIIRDVYREMWPRADGDCRRRTWDAWVKLP